MDVAAALRRCRLVPSVSPRGAAGHWQWKEQNLTIAMNQLRIVPRNQDRVLLAFSALGSTSASTVSPFSTVLASSRGISVSNTSGLLVIDFATWGPLTGADWYCRSIGPLGTLWVLEAAYLPDK